MKKNVEKAEDQSKVDNQEKIIDIKDVNEEEESSQSNENGSENELSVDTNETAEKLEAEIQELKDRLLRRAAEFENYKKRTEAEISEIIKYAAKDFIISILSVYDDLNRSLEHVKDAKDIDAIKSGMQLVFDKFTKVLKEQGVEKMQAKGSEFDFNLHDALMQQPSEDVPPDTVIEEVEPGYTYKEKVIKHAKVVVSRAVEND